MTTKKKKSSGTYVVPESPDGVRPVHMVVPVDDIAFNDFNPRDSIDPEYLDELAASATGRLRASDSSPNVIP